MCGTILMSLRPQSPRLNHFADSSRECFESNVHISNNSFGYPPPKIQTPELPATKAVNDLLGKTCRKDEEIENASSKRTSDNLHLPFNSYSDFPKIEWSFSESDNEELDTSDKMEMSIASAPARLINPSPNVKLRNARHHRRHSLVRSISLVSSILKEMQRTNGNLHSNSYTASRLKPVAHKRYQKAKIASAHHRLVTLEHPTTRQGLQVGHHEASRQFFL